MKINRREETEGFGREIRPHSFIEIMSRGNKILIEEETESTAIIVSVRSGFRLSVGGNFLKIVKEAKEVSKNGS